MQKVRKMKKSLQAIYDGKKVMIHYGGRNDREEAKRLRDTQHRKQHRRASDPGPHVISTCHVDFSELCNSAYATQQENKQNRVDL